MAVVRIIKRLRLMLRKNYELREKRLKRRVGLGWDGKILL